VLGVVAGAVIMVIGQTDKIVGPVVNVLVGTSLLITFHTYAVDGDGDGLGVSGRCRPGLAASYGREWF
jgi:hypothetical protein